MMDRRCRTYHDMMAVYHYLMLVGMFHGTVDKLAREAGVPDANMKSVLAYIRHHRASGHIVWSVSPGTTSPYGCDWWVSDSTDERVMKQIRASGHQVGVSLMNRNRFLQDVHKHHSYPELDDAALMSEAASRLMAV